MNCTGERCIIQYDKVDPATCPCVSYCPQATPPITTDDIVRIMTNWVAQQNGNIQVYDCLEIIDEIIRGILKTRRKNEAESD